MFFTHAAVEAKKSTGHPTHSHVCHAVYQNGLTAIGTLDISWWWWWWWRWQCGTFCHLHCIWWM